MTTALSQQQMIPVVGWYDNEWGYASRVADLASFISECERRGPRPERVRVVERERYARPASRRKVCCSSMALKVRGYAF